MSSQLDTLETDGTRFGYHKGMEELDRIETNCRLSLLAVKEQTQRIDRLEETASAFAETAQKLSTLAGDFASQVGGLKEGAHRVEERLEESIGVMRTFAESMTDVRRTLADAVRRIEILESEREAS